MSEPSGQSPNPFEGFLGDLVKMMGSLTGGGPVNWDLARQVAQWVATEGASEANIDPLERLQLEEVLRVADLHVAQISGLPTSLTGRVLTVAPVTRSAWSRRTLDAYRPVLERLASSMAVRPLAEQDPGADPSAQLLGGLPQVLGPFLMAAMAGSMVGHLAQWSLGEYDLPLPRPVADQVIVVPTNIKAFAQEWTLPLDELRLWVCLHEVAHHSVLGVAHVRVELESLLMRYAGGFDVDPSILEMKLGEVDPSDPESFQRVLGDPEVLLGAVQSDKQRQLLPKLEVLTSVIEGYVDHVMDTAGSRLISSYSMLSEALRRRRVEDAAGLRYVGNLFGLALSSSAYDRGGAFVRGALERAGEEGLARLWKSPRELPTQAELDAPGLWWERINLPE